MNATFRPLRPEDSISIAHNANNKNVSNNLRDHFPSPYSVTDAEDFIELSVSKIPATDFAVTLDDQAIGVIGYVRGTDFEKYSAEIGYFIGEEHWGKGIMSRVVNEFTHYLFSHTNIIHLHAPVFGFNKASMRVLEKAGFSRAGVFHGGGVKNGRIIDLVLYEKTHPDLSGSSFNLKK